MGKTGKYGSRMLALMLTVILMLGNLAGCEQKTDTTESQTDGAATEENRSTDGNLPETESAYSGAAEAITLLNSEEIFSSRDKEIGYDESLCIPIQLNGDTASCDSKAVVITGSTITITDEGYYLVSGNLEDGQIIVDAEKTDKIQLILNGVNIHCVTSAAIYVKQADKVFITLARETGNILSNSEEFVQIDDNKIDAVIYSRDDLTLNGLGSLEVNAVYGHGIVSKDDLIITGGTYQITAEKHGLSGKDCVGIADGTFTIVSGKDGIHAENEDDAEKGYLYIAGGAFALNSQGDGLDASSILQIDGGSFTVAAGGGSANGEQHGTQASMGSWRWPEASDTSDEDTVSTKGIKASGSLVINGGSFDLDTADDGIHSNADLSIQGGAFVITTGDDGIHGDGTVSVNGGVISIEESFEGIEGQYVEITGGEISIVSSDDGLNAAGGESAEGMGRGGFGFGAVPDCSISISGGSLRINASGDGIDSNGNLVIAGGVIYVSGQDGSGNSAIDYESTAVISGGILAAAGFSGMAENFSSDSTQGVMMVTLGNTWDGGTEITLSDGQENELITYTPEKRFNLVTLSCPEMAQGETYTVTVGTEIQTIEMTELIYGTGFGFGGGFGGGFQGEFRNDQAPGKGQKPGDGELPGRDQMPEDGELPEMGQSPGDGELPGRDQMPEDGEMPEMGQSPGDGELPGRDQMPEDGEMPEMGQMPGDGELPEMGQMPEDGELPGRGQMPGDGEQPGRGQMPEDGELPEMGRMPEDGELPGRGQMPEDGEIPEGDQSPEDSQTQDRNQI